MVLYIYNIIFLTFSGIHIFDSCFLKCQLIGSQELSPIFSDLFKLHGQVIFNLYHEDSLRWPKPTNQLVCPKSPMGLTSSYWLLEMWNNLKGGGLRLGNATKVKNLDYVNIIIQKRIIILKLRCEQRKY